MAAVECAQTMLFARQILESLQLQVELPMVLEIDCKGTVDLNKNWSVTEELDMSQSNTCSYVISKNLEYLRFVGYHQRQTVATCLPRIWMGRRFSSIKQSLLNKHLVDYSKGRVLESQKLEQSHRSSRVDWSYFGGARLGR